MRQVLKAVALSCFATIGFASIATAQSADQAKARAYYFAAEKALADRDFDGAASALDKARESLGQSNALLESLRIKILFNQGRMAEARDALDQFYARSDVSVDLQREMSPYLIDVEAALEAEAIAEEKRREAARIAEETRQARAALLAPYQEKHDALAASRPKGYVSLEDYKVYPDMDAPETIVWTSCPADMRSDGSRSQQIWRASNLSVIVRNDANDRESKTFIASSDRTDPMIRPVLDYRAFYHHVCWENTTEDPGREWLEQYTTLLDTMKTSTDDRSPFPDTDVPCLCENAVEALKALPVDAQPLIRIPPIMPPKFLRGNHSGYCDVAFDVSPVGEPIHVEATLCTNDILAKAAVKSVEKWRFNPTIIDGRPDVQTNVVSRVVFALSDSRGNVLPNPPGY